MYIQNCSAIQISKDFHGQNILLIYEMVRVEMGDCLQRTALPFVGNYYSSPNPPYTPPGPGLLFYLEGRIAIVP